MHRDHIINNNTNNIHNTNNSSKTNKKQPNQPPKRAKKNNFTRINLLYAPNSDVELEVTFGYDL